MSISIVPVISREDQDAVLHVRHEVFYREMNIPLSRLKLPEDSNAFDLLARDAVTGEPIAALTVLDTTGQQDLYRRYDLRFPAGARTVRYTQFAVSKPYRGLRVSLKLILEGHRLFVEPGEFDYSWLLFNARHASSSYLCRVLEFYPSAVTFPSEMGRSRVLTRNEQMADCKEAIRRAQDFVNGMDEARDSSTAFVSVSASTEPEHVSAFGPAGLRS